MGAIRRHPEGPAADRDRIDDRAGRRVDLTDRTAAVRDPDVGAIRRDPKGPLPTVIVLTTVPVDALISLTVPLLFATQTWPPTDDTP